MCHDGSDWRLDASGGGGGGGGDFVLDSSSTRTPSASRKVVSIVLVRNTRSLTRLWLATPNASRKMVSEFDSQGL